MVDYDTWFAEQGNTAISDSRRAVKAWKRIQRDADSITIKRNATTLDAQTVRIVAETSQPSEGITMPTSSAARTVNVFGVKNHPTVSDTNIQRGDLFVVGGVRYRVVSVITRPGEVHATAEVM